MMHINKVHFFAYILLLSLFFVSSSNITFSKPNSFAYRTSTKALKNPKSIYYTKKNFKSTSLSSFIKGKRYYKRRKYSKAIKYFSKYLKKKTPANDYALYYLGLSLYKLRKYNKAGSIFKKLHSLHPDSQFALSAIEYQGESYAKLGHWSKLLRQFKSEINRKTNPSLAAIYNYYTAYAYHNMKQYDKALAYYMKSAQSAKSKWNKRIIQRLKKLKKKSNIANYNHPGFVEIAIEHYLTGDFEKAIALLNKVRGLKSQNPRYKQKYYLALSYINIGQASKGRSLLKQISKEHREKKYSIPAAFAYYKSLEDSQMTRAIQGYKDLVRTYHSPLVVPIAKRLVYFYHKQNNWSKKIFYLRHLAKYNESKFVWSYLFHALNKNWLNRIVNDFPSVVKLLKDEKMKTKLLYWVGVAALKKKRYREAQNYFAKSYYGYKYNYYSYKSLLYIQAYSRKKRFNIRFSHLRREDKKRTKAFFKSTAFLNRYNKTFYPLFDGRDKPMLKRALYFLSLGFTGYGDKELERFLKQTPDKEKYYRGLAYYFKHTKRYQHAIRYAYRLVDYYNTSTGHNYITAELAPYCYPKRYERIIQKASKEYDLSKYLVMAVIREESRFNPNAKSWAGARGLMQIMPKTGRYLARQTNLKKYNLYDVETNVRMGCYYLSHLIKKFDSYSYALAGYNGGPGRMNSRLRKALKEGDHILTGEHLIELISNNETRNYVKKVLKSYYCYLDVYNQID